MLSTDFVSRTKAAIASITDPSLATSPVDINSCDREPIHIPNAIQPHGVLLVLSEAEVASDWIVTQVSQNTDLHLGKQPEALLNQPLRSLLSAAQIQTIEAGLSNELGAAHPLRLEIVVAGSAKKFSGVVHRSGEAVLLELEPIASAAEFGFFDFYSLIKRPVSRFQQAQTLDELCQAAVEEITQVSGFDRVMVYRFDEDGSGHVIAENKRAEATAYLGLRYPATDIPQQAKYLYVLNLLRLIPAVNYEPVPLVAAEESEAGGGQGSRAPLDMSLVGLRSVSPLHTEYLRNMGVQASMSVSLLVDNRLWGLIACHHDSPRRLSYEYRSICEFLGHAIASEVAAKADRQDAEYRLTLNALQARFVETLTQNLTLSECITQNPELMMALTGSTGMAFCHRGEITLLGNTPALAEVMSLVPWLAQQFATDVVYKTSALSEVYAPAADFAEAASGLLAIAISQVQQISIIWFRAEVLQTVDWAGNPNKSVEVGPDGVSKLSPRQSFARWQETVRGRSLPWQPCEQATALALRSAVIGFVLQRADELAELNAELERSNVELDSFAYIASHDLKEPLRGIHNYASFLIEDYGQTLGADGVHKLETLMRLTQRMENLISSLLHYSRLGRAELRLAPVDLNGLVDKVIELIEMSKPDEASFEIPRALPMMEGDRTQITELFTNLITNAIKYNDKDEKQVEIGYLTQLEAQQQGIWPQPADKAMAEKAPTVAQTVAQSIAPAALIFYVRDNGIGIRTKHLETVFRIFKRLHAPTRFGGGTGAGLTIAKKIVERHGGSLWIESVYTEGSTFYFTLENAELR